MGQNTRDLSLLLSAHEEQRNADNRFITMSTLALGLLVGVFGESSTFFEFVCWVMAALAFMICIVLLLVVANKHTGYLIALNNVLLPGAPGKKNDQYLMQTTDRSIVLLMRWVYIFFGAGALLTSIIAVINNGFINFDVLAKAFSTVDFCIGLSP